MSVIIATTMPEDMPPFIWTNNRPYKICYYGTQPAGNKYFVMAMEKLRDQFATANKDFLNTVIEKAYEIWARNTH